ncbi:MAG: hypothetical protein BWZ10_02247 [candidate division BRC1 bacterium ADurb.BinA364]|nr:MAG: hypothetical protein BWZ10_02247 [candidate division BRC1 bacterium ADurb.BinA364]
MNRFLNLRHVVGQTRDQAAGFQFVEIGEGEGLRLAEKGFAQIGAEGLHGDRGENAVSDAADRADRGETDHQQPGVQHKGQIQIRDSLIDDALHKARLQHIHRDFDSHQQRGQRDPMPIWLEKSQYAVFGLHCILAPRQGAVRIAACPAMFAPEPNLKSSPEPIPRPRKL